MSLIDVTDAKTTSFELIPEGDYTINCVTAEVKQTKSTTGEYINCKFAIVGGDHDGRVLFHMFNIKNDNPKAVEIGMGQLKSFLMASGVNNFKIQSAIELEGLTCQAKIKIKNDSYGEKNVISYFKEKNPVEEKLNQMKNEKIPF